jgi:hypothetical protein
LGKGKSEDLAKIITNTHVRTETETNEYRSITVYNLADAQRAKVFCLSYDKYFLDSYHEYDNVLYASLKFLKVHFNLTGEQVKAIHEKVRRRIFHDNEMKAVTCYAVDDVKKLFQFN